MNPVGLEPVRKRDIRNFGQHSGVLGVVRRMVHTSVSSETSREAPSVVRMKKPLHGFLKAARMLRGWFQPLMTLSKQFLIITVKGEILLLSPHGHALNTHGSTVICIALRQ